MPRRDLDPDVFEQSAWLLPADAFGSGLRLRVRAIDFGPSDILFVDTLSLTACRADLDSDGELTLFDFLAFQDLYDAEDPKIDIDGDGRLTVFDFLAFQNAYDEGCPKRMAGLPGRRGRQVIVPERVEGLPEADDKSR